jgi:CheY-like chemotaxis protein
MNDAKKKIHVLLADDDPGDRSRFQIALRLACPEIKVESVFNGMQLIDYLEKPDLGKLIGKEQAPDLIITDLYMPFAGGLQVLKQIRKHSFFKDIPIYVFSANNDKVIQLKMKEFGATEFHRKTPDSIEFQNIINHIIEKFAAGAAA